VLKMQVELDGGVAVRDPVERRAPISVDRILA